MESANETRDVDQGKVHLSNSRGPATGGLRAGITGHFRRNRSLHLN